MNFEITVIIIGFCMVLWNPARHAWQSTDSLVDFFTMLMTLIVYFIGAFLMSATIVGVGLMFVAFLIDPIRMASAVFESYQSLLL